MDPQRAKTTEKRLGIVSLDQLRELGVTKDAAKRRAGRGRLHRLHRGVYALGHPGVSREGTWMAAVLAVGRGAVLSHRSAAALWRMMTPVNADVEVTIPGDGGCRRRTGIRIHRSTTLTDRDTALRRNIPVTKPLRTLEDLRPRLSQPDFNAALRQAEIRGLPVDGIEIAGHDPSRSQLERRFVSLCRRHRLPHAEVNAVIGRYQADFLWRDEKLIAETDSYAFHRGRGAFELDRQREADLARAGYEVLRFTWRQVVEEPSEVAAAVRARLAARRGNAS